jgi:hypothetical protein
MQVPSSVSMRSQSGGAAEAGAPPYPSVAMNSLASSVPRGQHQSMQLVQRVIRMMQPRGTPRMSLQPKANVAKRFDVATRFVAHSGSPSGKRSQGTGFEPGAQSSSARLASAGGEASERIVVAGGGAASETTRCASRVFPPQAVATSAPDTSNARARRRHRA